MHGRVTNPPRHTVNTPKHLILSRARRSGRRLIDHFVRDLRVALRGLWRAPAFSVTVVLVLGAGIGVAVAMFAVIRAVLVKRLPVMDQDRVIVMWTVREGDVEADGGQDILKELRRVSRSLHDVGGVAHWGAQPAPFMDGDHPVTLNEGIVDGHFFSVLDVRPVLGRLLGPDDDPGGKFEPLSSAPLEHAMVLSYRAWRRSFGGDSSIIGRRLKDSYSQYVYTVVGVAPPGLDYPSGVDCWVPVGRDAGTSMIAVGRLKPGATAAAARLELLSVATRLVPEIHFSGADVHSLADLVLGHVRPGLTVLAAAVVLLLLIACFDVANLMLLRVAARGREIAIRRAVGASVSDLLTQLSAETVLLVGMAGQLAFGCAIVLLRILLLLAPPELPRTDVIGAGGAPVLLTAATSAVALGLVAIGPAVTTVRTEMGALLRIDGRSGGESRTRRQFRETLVMGQVALAFVMVCGAVLLTHSLVRLQQLNLGYQPEHLSVITTSLPWAKYDTMPKVMALGEALLPRMRAIPGVEAVTPILIPPFIGPNVWQVPFQIDGQAPSDAQKNPLVPIEAGDLDYFRTFGIRIERGHGFSPPNGPGAPTEVVVSSGVAHRFWPGEDAVGKRIRLSGFPDSGWRTIVGVVDDIHFRSLRDGTPMLFLRWRQAYWQGTFAVRTKGQLSAVLPALRAAVRDIDPSSYIWQAESMEEFMAAPLAEPRLNALLLSAFGVVALVLAALGLYGVMASTVRQQTREIGARMALGATPERVRGDFLRAALSITAIGIVAGVFVSFTSAKVITASLFDVSPSDPVAFCGSCVLLLIVGIAAAYVPARRATGIDPARALRND